jgi:hypothetical protein
MLLLLVPVAFGQTPPPPPDVSVSSLGVQTWTDSALREVGNATDVDVLLGQRLRWTLSGDQTRPGTDAVALIDANFLLDPGPEGTPVLEWNQVRQLAIEVEADKYTLDLGRTLVYRGGPRLVDGIQALYHTSQTVQVGVWAGLAPNLFTTEPVVRPGGGPILAYETSKAQLSIVGEALSYQGALDRAGVLTMARYSFERVLDLSGRLDLDLSDGVRLYDGRLQVDADPTASVHAEAMYDGFSSYEYQESYLLDPRLQRFSERLQLLGEQLGITQDTTDPRLYHLVGLSGRFQPQGDGVAPRFGLVVRDLTAPTAKDSYFRVNPSAGLVNLGPADVTVDANYLQVDGGTQYDAGVTLYLEPDDAGVSVDTSARLIVAPDEFPKPTYYADLFLNVVSAPLDLLFIAGGEVTSEPDLDGQDSVGFGAFVRMAKYVRPPRTRQATEVR